VKRVTKSKTAAGMLLVLLVLPGVAADCGSSAVTCYDPGHCGIGNPNAGQPGSQQQPALQQPAGNASSSPCPAGSWDAGQPNC
jgi:hypothetical protein